MKIWRCLRSVTENIPEPLHAEDLDLPQVHNMIFSDELEQPYDGGLYLSPINKWIEASCAHASYPNFDSFFYLNNPMLPFKFIHEQMLRHLCFMMILIMSLTKRRKRQLGIDKMQEWFHRLYAYT